MPRTPHIATLARWLHSWIQPSGAIHGFHNHSVWGGNPYRIGDFTCGHSTFASPLLPALALALRHRPDARGAAVLARLADYQATQLQPDGQFAHIGFQCGETLKFGLIHNMVPCAMLAALAPTAAIDRAVRGVLAACDGLYAAGPNAHTCCNQEYARLWARLLHMTTYGHAEWHDAVARALEHMIAQFHVPGLPDSGSAGTWRATNDPSGLEPAEYYGLMIHPLLLGAQRYGEPRFCEAALALARHCVRSSWVDARGQRRAHRCWHRVRGEWLALREPMLIGGFGITLSAIQALVRTQPDAELEGFLADMDATYAQYQSGAGFFLAATGWGTEADVIPSSAWQSHDLFYLLGRHGAPADFWDVLMAPDPRAAVVLGRNAVWIEAGARWALRGYTWMDGTNLVGRKDREEFALDVPAWIGSGRESPAAYRIADEPTFLRTDRAVYHFGGRTDLHVLAGESLPYVGPEDGVRR